VRVGAVSRLPCYHEYGMGIPNVKRFRPYCPECKENFTVMAVLPKDADVAAYLEDVVKRHDHKAFQESKQVHYKVRVGQQKQRKRT
jgi:hypothetical protein